MNEENGLTRRNLLKSGFAALATAGAITTTYAEQPPQVAEVHQQENRSSSNPGPKNPPLQEQIHRALPLALK